MCNVGGDVWIHSNVVLSLLAPAYSKNSPSFQFCAPTATLSVNNLYIIYTNMNTPTNDIMLPIELI